MSTAESGRRGYIYTGRVSELERHKSAARSMKSNIGDLRQELSSDPTQQQQVEELEQLVDQRLALFEQSVDLYQEDPSAIQVQDTITTQSIRLREKIQIALAMIRTKEKAQLNASLQQSQASIKGRLLIEQLGTLLIVIVFCGAAFLLYRERVRWQRFQSLEQTLAQERELSELKLHLFSMISHEFRTPLSVILASSQLLNEILENQLGPDAVKNLARIQTSAKLMNQLLTDILTVTRAEIGKLEYRPEPLDIEAFCLNLLDDVQSSNTRQTVFHFTIQGRCSRVLLDEKILYSILSNLLLNAVKYSPLESQVDLTLKCEPEATFFEVKDRGIGILAEDQEKIFEAFYRGKNVEGISGSGLGLAVVRKCLDLCDGSIDFNSREGIGTTFVVRIPQVIN